MRDRNDYSLVAIFATVMVSIAAGAALWTVVAAILTNLGPLGSLALAAALVLVPVYVSRVRKSRDTRATAGYCGECGYDLRANADVCPERGSPLPEEILRRRRLRSGVQLAKN